MPVLPKARSLLQKLLSPKTYNDARFHWWCAGYYGRRLASRFTCQLPGVRAFGAAADGSALARQLRSVNALAPTPMCRVMTKYGSDKGRGWHNYTTLYSALFSGRRKESLRIFELGLGTNNPTLSSSMGVYGLPGASLRGWRELFPRALVYGADIDRAILFQDDRIKTFYCDQLDPKAICELWSDPEFQDGLDIIIEDGLHTFQANISFLEGSLSHLRPGGTYIVEDIEGKCIQDWYDRIENVYAKQYPGYEFAFVVLPNSMNRVDNNLLIVRRAAPETSLAL